MNTIAQTNPDSYPPNWNHPDGYSPSASAPVAPDHQWRLQILRGLQVNGVAHWPGEFLRHTDFQPTESVGGFFNNAESIHNMISAGQLQWVPPSMWNA